MLERSPERQEKQFCAALLEAIQCSRVALEGQIDEVSVEVSLFWADLQKVADKVTVAESNIMTLQTKLRQLKQQVAHMTKVTTTLEEEVAEEVLDAALKLEEIRLALACLPGGKSPGNDGFPAEFY
ncbi:hypothetical protein NDU88_007033 [Pleurodeles waltl]|uniref:Uncharacterized protein n=1 Tax=Pleurodeles waltl TaxID=8319 RepID=A0AAV7TYK4_PLEWA|nr:hypothetical protein NDU88_007033 [Pleurodeles waltl]